MTRDDIYDHLAQVYLGKRKKVDTKNKKQFNAWLVINCLITALIFFSAFYGLTAFLTQQKDVIQDKVIYSLHHGPVRIEYNFKDSDHPTEAFALNIPHIDAQKYNSVHFSMRGKEEGVPGIVKIVFNNQRNESSAYYVQGIGLKWKEFSIPLEEFKNITDWGSLTNLTFELESWNVDNKKGIVLIDDINFARAQ